MWTLIFAAVAVASECEPVSVSALDTVLDDAELAYSGFAFDRFTQLVLESAMLLPCVNEPIAADVAAQFHRLQGIRLFLARRTEDAQAAFAAARRAEPDYAFSPSFIPEGHQIRREYVATDLDSVSAVPVDEPADGVLRFDGVEALERPKSIPTIVQLVRDDAAAWTRLVSPRDGMPSYAVKETPPPEVAPASAPEAVGTKTVQSPKASPGASKHKPRWAAIGVTSAGVGLGALSGVQFARSLSLHQQYLATVDDRQAEALYQDEFRPVRNVATGAGAGAAALLGTGVLLFALPVDLQVRPHGIALGGRW